MKLCLPLLKEVIYRNVSTLIEINKCTEYQDFCFKSYFYVDLKIKINMILLRKIVTILELFL